MKCIVVFLCNKIHTFNTISVLCFLIQFLYKTILDISVVHMCTFVSFLFAFPSLTAGRQWREVILSFFLSTRRHGSDYDTSLYFFTKLPLIWIKLLFSVRLSPSPLVNRLSLWLLVHLCRKLQSQTDQTFISGTRGEPGLQQQSLVEDLAVTKPRGGTCGEHHKHLWLFLYLWIFRTNGLNCGAGHCVQNILAVWTQLSLSTSLCPTPQNHFLDAVHEIQHASQTHTFVRVTALERVQNCKRRGSWRGQHQPTSAKLKSFYLILSVSEARTMEFTGWKNQALCYAWILL